MGYIITGYTGSWVEKSTGEGGYSYDLLLIRTDVEGNEMWTKKFGGQEYDVGYSVQPTADGGFIITGETKSFGAGRTDVFLIKVNGDGK